MRVIPAEVVEEDRDLEIHWPIEVAYLMRRANVLPSEVVVIPDFDAFWICASHEGFAADITLVRIVMTILVRTSEVQLQFNAKFIEDLLLPEDQLVQEL